MIHRTALGRYALPVAGFLAAVSCAPEVAIGPGGIAAVRVVPDSLDIAVGDSAVFQAAALDASGALLSGKTVSWAIDDAAVASVDQSGVVTAVAAGTTVLRATIEEMAGSATVRVLPRPAIALSSSNAAINVSAGGAAPPATTVQVTNSGGFSINDLAVGAVVYGAGATDWLTASLDGSTAPAALSLGFVDGSVTAAGRYTATVPVTSSEATNSPQSVTVSLTVTAGIPDTLAVVSGDGQSAIAGTAVAGPISVRVGDAFGNPASGATIAFAVTAGGGTLSGASPATDSAGVATLGGWTLGTVVGANTLTATLGSLTVTFNATGTPGAPARVSIVAGDGQTAVVATAVATAPSVLVQDSNGNAVPGADVTFVASGTGIVSPAGGVVTSDGTGTATLTAWTVSQTVGANSLTATVGGLTPAVFSATGTPGSAASIAINAGDGQTATVGASVATAPSVVVNDQFGNVVPGVSVTFAVASGGGTVDPGTPVSTGADGIAAANSWTLGLVAGVNTLTATAAGSGISGNPVTFAATGQAGSAGALSISVQPASNAQNAVVIAPGPTIQVQDQNGNPVNQSGVAITATVASGPGGVLSGSTVVNSDASGQAIFSNLTITGATGDYTLGFTATNLSGAVSNAVALGPGAATNIAVNDGDAQTATVNTVVATDPSVLVTDASGNPVPGVNVTFSVTAGGGAVTGATPVTDAAGVARAGSWTLGTVAGANALNAASAGLAGSPVSFSATGTPDAPDAGTSTVAAAPASISAGSEQSTVTVTVTDQFGNAVQGATVVLAATGTGNTIAQPGSVTDAAGQTTGAMSSSVTEAKTVSATVNGTVAITDNAVVTVGVGIADAGQSTVDVSTGSIAASNGSSSTTVTVTARDASGNALAGLAVNLAVSGSNNSLGSASGTTGADGTFSTSLSSTSAEGKTVTATAGGVGITDNALVAVNADVAASIAAQPLPEDSARVGSALATPPSVLVTDQFGNVVGGEAVTFAVTNGGGNITGANQVTNASGIATLGSWTVDSVSGGMSPDGTFANVVSATITAGSTSVTARSYFTLAGDVQAVWVATASCQACHTGFPSTGTAFNISTSALTFSTTVGVAASCDAGETRVVAGSPSTSVLMVRLDGGAIGACSTGPMPPAGVLTAAQREIVRAWIQHGAFNN